MKTININEINASLAKKLNKNELYMLNNALNDLCKAQKYILKSDTFFGSKDRGTPYGTSYVNKAGEGISEHNKEVGTELCYLYNAIGKLKSILEPIEVEIDD